MSCVPYMMHKSFVTPGAGVWIEIRLRTLYFPFQLVTPGAGVWIEIVVNVQRKRGKTGHSRCGSVD